MRIRSINPIQNLRDDQILASEDLLKVRKSICVGILNSITELFALVCAFPIFEVVAQTESPIGSRVFERLGFFGEDQILIGSLMVFLFGQMLRFLVNYTKIRLNAKYKKILSEHVGQSLYMSYLTLDNKGMAEENSVSNAQNVVNSGVYVNYRVASKVSLIAESFTLMLLIVVMSIYSPGFIFPVFGLSGLVAFVIYKLTINSVRFSGKVVADRTKIRNRILNESLRNIDEIQIFGNHKFFYDLFRNANHLTLSGEQKYEQVTSLVPIAIELSVVLVFCLVFVVQIALGVSTSTVLATVGILLIGALRIIPSLGRIVNELQKQGFGLDVKTVIQRDISASIDLRNGKDTSGIDRTDSKRFESVSIQVFDLSYKYSNRVEQTISRLNFTFEGKQLFGIKGKSGSGKSTLLRLLLGICRPDAGAVYANGEEVYANRTVWRSIIGYVPQSVFFIDGTVRDNIVFGGKDQPTSEVLDVLEKVGLNDYINSLPDGIDTYLGEGGETLSGGQRQRIGIARALYRNPSVLILDEPTSALDDVATSTLVRTLKELSNSILVITASHEIVLLQACDSVLELDGELKSDMKLKFD